MTIALEHVQDADWAALNRVIDTLRSLVLDTGGVSLGTRIGGTKSATWPGGGAASGTVTIAHGLGKTPVYANASSHDTLFEYAVTTRDATNITVIGYITTNTVVAASTRTFDWRVEG